MIPERVLKFPELNGGHAPFLTLHSGKLLCDLVSWLR